MAKTSGRRKATPITMNDVQTHLMEQSKKLLVEMLVEQALQDEHLRERLLMKVATHRAKATGGKANIQPFIDAIDNAVQSHGFVGYREVPGYAQGIEDAIEAVETLLKDGHATEAMQVSDYALGAVHRAIERVDDSDGCVGGILYRIAELHLAACKKARPDPEALAQRLLELELKMDYGDFRGSVAAYAGVLGTRGLAKYRALAEALWVNVPTLMPGQDAGERGNRYAITMIMEALAATSGDLDEWIAVKSRDLSHAYVYLTIAEACAKARKHDLALTWAEKGIKAFPVRTDSRLREFLAEEYHRRKRHDEAMALIWQAFTESPGLRTYQTLQKHALRIKDWPAWRDQAIAFVRESIAKEKQAKPQRQYGWYRNTDNSTLVEILLWEKDGDAAWREAQGGGCTNDLWLKLAKDRAPDHPEDALPIYMKQVEPTLAAKNNGAYEEAVKYLRIIRDLMNRLGKTGEFAAYLASVRIAHKPKRNFMKLLDKFN